MPPSPGSFTLPPDPGQAATLDDLVRQLRLLKVWAGDPSYERVTDRINGERAGGETARKTTVADCFKTGRRRINTDLVIAVVRALYPDVGYAAQWRQALRVVGGETRAASQVRVQDTLPQDLPEFTGRGAELDRLLRAARRGGGTAVVSVIEGMAGVGKTQLAVHAGHLLDREKVFERVLFVNLRGFHPDPAQPPADPAAVLDGFLRVLGVPGQNIPHDLDARSAAYRDRLAGTRTLVILDNAAEVERVRPLLPATPGSLTLITSRRSLAGLNPAARVSVDVFTPDEAVAFLNHAAPETPAGPDPQAPARIAERCGHLPLALGLVAGHIRGAQGWTLTDHADRLDERHRHRHLDTGVELALNLSYQSLPAGQQRLLRLVSLHPGQDIDAHAAAALSGTDPAAATALLHDLCRDHLLQEAAPGRYGLHDLVRAYAGGRTGDEDPPPQRLAAMTRLFDFYLVTAAAAMDLAYPRDRPCRPAIVPGRAQTPDLAGTKEACLWLDTEMDNLIAVAQHAAEHGWPQHTWRLSAVLDRHLLIRGQHREARTLHRQAVQVARKIEDQRAEMNALNRLGTADRMLGGFEESGAHHERALRIAQDIGDRAGELNALNGYGMIHLLQGRHVMAHDHHERALRIAEDIGDRAGELNALIGLGYVHRMRACYAPATGHFQLALQIARQIGDHIGERTALYGLGEVDRSLGHYERAAAHHERALQIAQEIGDRAGELYGLSNLGYGQHLLGQNEEAAASIERALRIAQDIGDRVGELGALNILGDVHLMLGHHPQAAGYYERALDLARKLGNGNGKYEALQGLGRLSHATGDHDLALTRHQLALQCATDLAQPQDQARAHDGIAHAYLALGRHGPAGRHWQRALDILTGLGTDQIGDVKASVPNIRAHLTDLSAVGWARSGRK